MRENKKDLGGSVVAIGGMGWWLLEVGGGEVVRLEDWWRRLFSTIYPKV